MFWPLSTPPTSLLSYANTLCPPFLHSCPLPSSQGLVTEPHDHWENPSTKRRVHTLLDVSDSLSLLRRIAPRPASRPEITRAHTETYYEKVVEISKHGGGDTGDYAHMRSGGLNLALLAAGAAISGVESLLCDQVDACYVLSRPPGHHATIERGMGFCVFANISIAIRHLQVATRELDLGPVEVVETGGDAGGPAKKLIPASPLRVAVIDLDVHHGNGTQDIFYTDPYTLTISVHQHGLYPRETGYIGEIGADLPETTDINRNSQSNNHDICSNISSDQTINDPVVKKPSRVTAKGRNINIPLPSGSGNGTYLYVTEQVIVPALKAFAPDLVVFAMGYDASAYDPLGRMMISTSGYADVITTILRVCEGMSSRLPIVERNDYEAWKQGNNTTTTNSTQPSSPPLLSRRRRRRFPVLAVHEGGYSPVLVPYAAAAVIDRLIAYTLDNNITNNSGDIQANTTNDMANTKGNSQGNTNRRPQSRLPPLCPSAVNQMTHVKLDTSKLTSSSVPTGECKTLERHQGRLDHPSTSHTCDVYVADGCSKEALLAAMTAAHSQMVWSTNSNSTIKKNQHDTVTSTTAIDQDPNKATKDSMCRSNTTLPPHLLSALAYNPHQPSSTLGDVSRPKHSSHSSTNWQVYAPDASAPYQYLNLVDPFHAELSTIPYQQLQTHHKEIIDFVREKVVDGALKESIEMEFGQD